MFQVVRGFSRDGAGHKRPTIGGREGDKRWTRWGTRAGGGQEKDKRGTGRGTRGGQGGEKRGTREGEEGDKRGTGGRQEEN